MYVSVVSDKFEKAATHWDRLPCTDELRQLGIGMTGRSIETTSRAGDASSKSPSIRTQLRSPISPLRQKYPERPPSTGLWLPAALREAALHGHYWLYSPQRPKSGANTKPQIYLGADISR